MHDTIIVLDKGISAPAFAMSTDHLTALLFLRRNSYGRTKLIGFTTSLRREDKNYSRVAIELHDYYHDEKGRWTRGSVLQAGARMASALAECKVLTGKEAPSICNIASRIILVTYQVSKLLVETRITRNS